MTSDDALTFLKTHQPLPPDDALNEATLERFDEIRKYFRDNPDPECVQLFLNAFGDGSGFGVYQLVGKTLVEQDRERVVRELIYALQSPRRSIQNWASEIAALFPDERLLEPLGVLLRDGDFDLKYAVLTALEQIAGDARDVLLRKFIDEEEDAELINVARGIIGFDEP